MPNASAAERELTTEESDLVSGVRGGDRRILAKAITRIESNRADHQVSAERILDALLPRTGKSLRVGISGSPGVGKSTFIEALGLHIIGTGQRLAVLAVDPSSEVSGGSILGDKTRMELLTREETAFIRPSPTGGTLGGVANRTRESLLLCEAAGFDVVIVETVGVGQSETAVATMVDLFTLLQLPNAGDDLQGIKRGIMELVDLVVINKSDTDQAATQLCQAQFNAALHLLKPRSTHWSPPVVTASALKGHGIAEYWEQVLRFQRTVGESGEIETRRRRQAVEWMWSLVDNGLRTRFENHPGVRERLGGVIKALSAGQMLPRQASRELLDSLD